jgi:prevent-host-death family protein
LDSVQQSANRHTEYSPRIACYTVLRMPTLGYTERMTAVPVRELRNHTADVVRRVQSGEDITITANGVAVAALVPVRQHKRASIGRVDLIAALEYPADSALRADLAELAGNTTDDLGPIR